MSVSLYFQLFLAWTFVVDEFLIYILTCGHIHIARRALTEPCIGAWNEAREQQAQRGKSLVQNLISWWHERHIEWENYREECRKEEEGVGLVVKLRVKVEYSPRQYFFYLIITCSFIFQWVIFILILCWLLNFIIMVVWTLLPFIVLGAWTSIKLC